MLPQRRSRPRRAAPARDLDEVRAGWQDVELASFDDAVFDDAVLDARAGLRPQQP